VLLVIAGRANVTKRNFPAAFAGLVMNVVLLVLLVPSYGIAGAGGALCGAYLAMLAVMHVLVRRAFRADFEWRRLAHVILIMGGLTAACDLALPTSGAIGFLTRALVWAAIPPVLYVTRFAHPQELAQARRLVVAAKRGMVRREPA
jgi:O-antigen/teichoic acid export membrane protein